jgi:hypothetical protein
MAGFPTRTGRDAFGPDPINTRYVKDPRREMDESIGRLAFWQMGGAGLLSPLAMVHVLVLNQGFPTLNRHTEAFQPRGGSPPTITWESSAGYYAITYAATYPDAAGEQVPLVFSGGVAQMSDVYTPLHGQVVAANNGHTAFVRFWDLAGTPVECASWLAILW